MNTSTGIAVAIAVVVALSFLFLGSYIFAPFSPESQEFGVPTGEANQSFMVTDQIVGTGAEVAVGSIVTVTYVGQLEDGSIFDASANHEGTFTFTLGKDPVIAGWEQGLIGMREGGTRVLVVPPELGYGSVDYGPIPANSTLTFTIELLKVE